MVRNIGGVVLGLILGSIANMALISLNVTLFPMPEGVGMEDQEAFKAYIASLPPAGFLLPFLAHFSQVVLGGLVAAKIGKAAPWKLVGIIGGLTVLGSVVNNLTIQPPAWTWLELPLCVPAIWGTIRLAERMRGMPESAALQAGPG
jgi:hypothetical protein